MTAPLVSVMIPAFNAAKTLPVALASLLAQTYQNWECIVVDDGSTDSTSELMSNVVTCDKRFKFIRLGENFGRAVARQNALDNAQGQYLAMIDADDWIYPSKLEQQVRILENHSELALVSCGMAIVDSENHLLGIRAERHEFLIYGPLKAPCAPPVAHAASMIRLSIAKSVGYDSRFEQTEDAEFLLRILMKYPFAVNGQPQYVYAEHAHSADVNVIIRSHLDLLKIYSKYLREFPLKTVSQVLRTSLKLVIAVGLKLFSQEKALASFRKLAVPTEIQINEYNRAYLDVIGECENVMRFK